MESALKNLSKDCICEILSRTSPSDAARFAVVSKEFKSIVHGEMVWQMMWEKFLPAEVVSRSTFLLVNSSSSKRKLFLTLCNSHIKLDCGKLSFSLDKKTGKLCFLVGARELSIESVDNQRYWKWTSNKYSRFPEVAWLHSRYLLNIEGKIKVRMLSRETHYAAYLKFKKVDQNDGPHIAHGAINRKRVNVLVLHGEYKKNDARRPMCRADGWMEIEIGDFHSDNFGQDDDHEVLAWVKGRDSHYGLHLEGIEFRPKI